MKKAIGIILSIIGWIAAVLCFLGLLGGIGTLVQRKGASSDSETVGLIWLLALGTAAGVLFIVLGKKIRTAQKQDAQNGASVKKGTSPLAACVLALGVLFFIGGIVIRVFPSGAAKTNAPAVRGETEIQPEKEVELAFDSEPEPKPESEQVIAARTLLEKTYESRVFDESFNLAEHPGLLDHTVVTGPFLQIVKGDGEPYVPDFPEGETPDPALPDGVRIVSASDGNIPDEYLNLLLTPDKEKAVSEGQGVFALLEYTGYGSAGEYIGGFKLYYHRSRISFYDLSTGDMIAWMKTTDIRSGPPSLGFGEYDSDGQHPILKYESGSIWNIPLVWTTALDELFYDGNGYQVVGTRLLSVPEGVDPIVVPEGVTHIGDNVGCYHTASAVLLPDSLISIGYAAFAHSAIEEAAIPANVQYVDAYAFTYTPWWESREKEDYVIVGDGVLMYARAQGDDITLPDDVRYVMPQALDGLSCRKLTIPATVQQLCGRDDFSVLYLEGTLETLVIRGGLDDVLTAPNAEVRIAYYCNALKSVVVDCGVETLHPDWLKVNSERKEQLTIYCKEGSAAEKWAEKNDVKHLPLSEFEP